MDEQLIPSNPGERLSKQHTLLFVSHSHRKPFSPRPNMTFDLRKIQNPPKHIRDAYDGHSKRLREHMLANEDFVQLLEAAKLRVAEEISRLGEDADETQQEAALQDLEQVNSASEGGDGSVGVDANHDSTQFVVSCFCERGKHRSVAFAEELARLQWSRNWDVKVYHRDVEDTARKKQGCRKSQKESAQNALVHDEE